MLETNPQDGRQKHFLTPYSTTISSSNDNPYQYKSPDMENQRIEEVDENRTYVLIDQYVWEIINYRPE
ncbi:MAG: hypothetical protein K9I74_12285 [Bacteroidales bacterium]|nr:hypothetical protein [Bacteroidales bacterium]